MRQGTKTRSIEGIMEFIFEAGLLKRTPRSGWSVVGVSSPESVADHSFRCAALGYLLAHMEKVSSERVLLMTLFNDIHEARITDFHKMAQRYIDSEKAEDTSFKEQVSNLPEGVKKEMLGLRREYNEHMTKASVIARDADILECLIQAKEYQAQGWKAAGLFFKKAPKFLKTTSAKRLWQGVKGVDINKWWLSLSEFLR